MRLVIAFVPNMLRPEVRAVGEEVGAEFADVSHSDMAYGELVARLWSAGQSFVLCEHDVVATPELLEEMWQCPADWCAGFAYAYHGAVMPGEDRPQHPGRDRVTALMLNKFSASLIARTPHVPSATKVRWSMVDLALMPMLGAKPCLHGPMAHLHAAPSAWLPLIGANEWTDA
jgi:hypothetical protein